MGCGDFRRAAVRDICNPASFVFLAGSVILVAIYRRPQRSVPEASRAWSGDDVSAPEALAPAGVSVVPRDDDRAEAMSV